MNSYQMGGLLKGGSTWGGHTDRPDVVKPAGEKTCKNMASTPRATHPGETVVADERKNPLKQTQRLGTT